MPEKPPRQHPKPSAFTATDLARAAAKMGAAQDLAKQLAAITAPIDALKNAIPVLPATYQIIQAHQTAADLVKALSGYSALSDLAKNFATSLPKVNLNLPDMSRRYRRPYLSQFRTYPCGTKAGRLPANQQRRRGPMPPQANCPILRSIRPKIWGCCSAKHAKSEISRSNVSLTSQAWDADLSLNWRMVKRPSSWERS